MEGFSIQTLGRHHVVGFDFMENVLPRYAKNDVISINDFIVFMGGHSSLDWRSPNLNFPLDIFKFEIEKGLN